MAIRDLDELLRTLTVRRRPGRWCLVSSPALPLDVAVAATVVEDEGTTAVIEVADAERLGIEPGFVAAWLTLEVVSALDAVGLTAAVATALADQGIAGNVLAGFHHDHLLVPVDRADDAIAALDALRARARAAGDRTDPSGSSSSTAASPDDGGNEETRTSSGR